MESVFQVRTVGYVRSPIRDRDGAPRQGRDAGLEVSVEILPDYAQCIQGLEGWDLVQVICFMHLASRDARMVHPRGDPANPLTGVFGTRSPARPNPLAVYTSELLGVDGLTLRLRGIDAVDGTPVLDIKPHVRRLDD
ncbi:MAG: tRNA (N6-threonylcarbamoyladenosine(37)-N6)-methyltransferase TrmO [bacterium]|nr:MAG: tRNA (N6-threonylcarbamoyladenosine(37)-N6)-methyltransferase TrmO [bacterium]